MSSRRFARRSPLRRVLATDRRPGGLLHVPGGQESALLRTARVDVHHHQVSEANVCQKDTG